MTTDSQNESAPVDYISHPIGRPKQCPRKISSTEAPIQHMVAESAAAENIRVDPVLPAGRPGDSGVGRPPQRPKISQIIEGKPRPPEPNGEDVDPSLVIRKTEIWAPNVLRSPIVYFGGLLIMSLIGIWLLTSVIELVGNLALLPPWLAYACTSILAVLLGIVLFLLGSVTWRYVRMPLRPQLDLTQIRRRDMSHYRAYGAARIQLSSWLREINGQGSQYLDVLKQCGLTDEECTKFQNDLRRLLRDSADSTAWLNEYLDNVQTVLDDLASRRQRHYAAIVGMKTAISPWPFVDLLAVLYNNTMLVRDLCALANRRADGLRSLSILAHVGFNAFIASEAQNLAAKGAEKAFDGYEKLADGMNIDDTLVSEGMADGLAEGAKGLAADGIKAVSKLAVAKLGEGLTNAWLTQRFGVRVWNLLTPLAD